MRLSCPLDEKPCKIPWRLPLPLEPANSGTTAREGKRESVSTSSGDLTVLSRYSRIRAKPMPPTKPTRKARARLRVLAGRAGVEGIMARSEERRVGKEGEGGGWTYDEKDRGRRTHDIGE